MTTRDRKLDLLHFSLHGLIRGHDLELGRDPDTGGQCLYVVELVRALARHPRVGRVSLVTRSVRDARISADYAVEREPLAANADIVRIEAGPRRYLRKEVLWRHLDAVIDRTLAMLRRERRVPDLIHAHYADAGYVGRQVAAVLGCPFVFTGHSLGRCKRDSLLESGLDPAEIDRRYNLGARIEAEELSLDAASLICTSTRQEIDEQYACYDHHAVARTRVIPPGVDLSRFDGPIDEPMDAGICALFEPFLRDSQRLPVLAIARADERKNLPGLVRAFAGNAFLRERANLIIIGGNRETLDKLAPGARRVWMDLFRAIDDGGLYGIAAYPKVHEPAQIAAIYRWAAARGGVFVNPAFTEPFGLTLLEAAAAGMPLVATNDGGPRDIIANCGNGVLIDPHDERGLGEAIESILADPVRRDELAVRGRERVRAHYSWDAHVAGYLDQVDGILPAERPVRRSGSPGALVERERWVVMDLPPRMEEQPEELVRRWREMFDRHPDVGFGVATGESFAVAWEVIRRCGMPEPGFVIGGLGAEIRYGEVGAPDESWLHQVGYRWRRAAIEEALSVMPALRLQPSENQNPLKLSYYMDMSMPVTRMEIQRCLRSAGLSAKVMVSAGSLVDILPVRSGKDVALRYLEHRWGIPADRIFYFGTYANDLAAVRGHHRSAIAGDADRVLRQLRARPRLYHARGAGLAGFFEGLEYFRFLDGGDHAGEAAGPADGAADDAVEPGELHP